MAERFAAHQLRSAEIYQAITRFYYDVIAANPGSYTITGTNLNFAGINVDVVKYTRVLLGCSRRSSQ